MEVPQGGYVGGLLITNRFGRPLEFQCTSPVKPNHTQEILYGPTLRPYLLGELIGKTLVDRVDVKPHLVLTEQADILEVRNHVSVPVVVVGDDAQLNSPEQSSAPESDPSVSETLGFRRKSLRFHQAHQLDRETVQNAVGEIPREFNLAEPFERIREALNETIQSGA